jgi:hypothetical protein
VALQYWIETGPASRKLRRLLLSSVVLVFCLVEQINLRRRLARRARRRRVHRVCAGRPPAGVAGAGRYPVAQPLE